jgi:UDP-N-acetylmuramyl tripeptide synthase
VLEPDRLEAIRRALDAAGSNDVIVIAGRGPETEQIFARHRVAFLDEQVARSLHDDAPNPASS